MNGAKMSRVIELEFASRAEELQRVRAAVRREALAQGCNPDCAEDIVMAVDEACQNVIRHAYHWDPEGRIVLEIERCGEDLVLSLRDFAPKVSPERVKPRDLDDPRPGGIGTHLIRTLMDRAEFVSVPDAHGNLLRMVKRIE